ncbi:3-oxoacyl-[acyl-carrier-protein] synthase-3 [Anaerovirgula multivorans]|uniref:3-oxoacyl-[acyl-carrier-protein] synthase-3 n=1 Tax=Anaerovirgula multivorans TaxID=312168 RepID=A0A239J9B6_9FIRM|nr:ketoacyl-ACP synthase III [Anaerovirgula multivorans]SNT01244.1 3-oxoacyl-[acyl-carrier-protein] synthase-3 [Anaerovirgula multivorans]
MEVKINGNGTYFAGIKGIGHYVPENIVTNDDLAKKINTTNEWISTKIGVKTRRIASEHEALSDIAYEASKRALANAKIKPEEIDLIILSRLDPDHLDPPTSCLVQSLLGAKNAATFDIAIGGCAGSVYSLAIATDFVKSGACRNVLAISGDVNSRNIIDWSDRQTCCFFGDGIAATVVSRIKEDKGIKSYQLKVDGSKYDVIIMPIGGSRTPITEKNVNSRERYVVMNNREVWNFATTVGPQIVKDVTAIAGKEVSELDWVIFHQANKNIIRNNMNTLGLPMEKTYTTIEKYGNTGGASVLLTLSEAVETGLVKTGDKIALAAFGAGLAWGGLYLEWCAEEDFI